MKNLLRAKKNLEFVLENAFGKLEFINHIENFEAFKNKVHAKVSPQNPEECLELLKIAREFKCPIYPISAGKNWGFGASIPTTDNCILMDLSFLKAISGYDEELGTLKIQAGVTQQELHDYLKKIQSPFRIDVTGSGADTSILGNALERGIGYQALRHEHILSMKILLMDGSIIETGYSRFQNSELGKCLSYGLGPSFNHLFTQSNFGIVLEATLKLMKKQDYECAFSFSINTDEDLEKTTLLIQELFDNSIITSIPKVFDKRRFEVTFCPKYFVHATQHGKKISRKEILEKFELSWGNKKWTFVTSLGGPYEVVQSKLRYIQEKLGNMASLRIVDHASIKKAEATLGFDAELQCQFDKLILGYLQGTPSNDALMSTYWDVSEFEHSPDKANDKSYGFLYIAPLVPNKIKELNNFLKNYREVNKKFSLNPAMTLNYLNRNSIEAVISLTFNKENPFEVKRAHNYKQNLLKVLSEIGHYPYRLDSASMGDFEWDELSAKIKASLDPEALLAPIRYSKT